MQKNDKSEVIINIKSKDDIIEELQAEVKNVRENFTFQLNNNHKNDDIIYRLKKEIKHQEFLISELKKEIEFQRDLLSEPCSECKERIKGSKQ